MRNTQDIVRIVSAATALGRIAAVTTKNETPAAQWRTLAILISEGPQRIGELARLSRVTQPGMTRLIGTMTEAGLLAREEDPSDSRAHLISVTAEGRTALEAWQTQLGEALSPFFADLPDEDWETLRRASDILASRIASSQESHR